MRFLADEHIPNAVIARLRDDGHEVLAASQIAQGATDAEHVSFAAREGLVILTEDEDFTARVRETAAGGDPLPPALIHYRLDGLGRVAKRFSPAANSAPARRHSASKAASPPWASSLCAAPYC